METRNELIRVENVTKEYNNGAVRALSESSLSIYQGEVVAIPPAAANPPCSGV